MMYESRDIENKKIRVVIDTGVWISFFIGKVLKKLGHYIKKENIIFLFSDELFDEIIEVLNRPTIKKYIKEDQVYEILGIIKYKAEWIKIKERTDICGDKKDNFLLDLSYNGDADYLITGDDGLLVIEHFKGTKIINFREFDEIFSRPR